MIKYKEGITMKSSNLDQLKKEYMDIPIPYHYQLCHDRGGKWDYKGRQLQH